jgi:hypothetical protein
VERLSLKPSAARRRELRSHCRGDAEAQDIAARDWALTEN